LDSRVLKHGQPDSIAIPDTLSCLETNKTFYYADDIDLSLNKNPALKLDIRFHDSI